jgi:hypothetical protein
MNPEYENGMAEKFVKRIKQRLLYLNKNWLAIVCGETGSGKSYSAISLASKIGRVHIVFTPVEFLRLLNSDRLQKGDVVVFDEAGVGMSSREWYSVQNKLLGSVLQTFRLLNCAVIFTTPNLSFIDVQARKLFHNYFETSYIDYEEEEAYLQVYDIQVNSRFDKIYFKYPIFQVGERPMKMSHLIIPKPNPKTIEYYEARKKAYTNSLNRKALEELTGSKEKPNPQIDEKAILKDIIKRKKEFVKEYQQRKYVDKDLIKAEYNLSHRITAKLKKLAEKEVLN